MERLLSGAVAVGINHDIIFAGVQVLAEFKMGFLASLNMQTPRRLIPLLAALLLLI